MWLTNGNKSLIILEQQLQTSQSPLYLNNLAAVIYTNKHFASWCVESLRSEPISAVPASMINGFKTNPVNLEVYLNYPADFILFIIMAHGRKTNMITEIP